MAGTPGCDSPASRSGLAPEVTLCTTYYAGDTRYYCARACVSASVLYGTRFSNSLTRDALNSPLGSIMMNDRPLRRANTFTKLNSYNRLGQWGSTITGYISLGSNLKRLFWDTIKAFRLFILTPRPTQKYK